MKTAEFVAKIYFW